MAQRDFPHGTTVIVTVGDCVSSIAAAAGHLPATIWEDSGNGALVERREDSNVLLRGDEVFVPHLRQGWVPASAGRVHRFRRKGVPEKLRVRILDLQRAPRPDAQFRFVIDGETMSGVTDSDGYLDVWVPPGAIHATLQIGRDVFDVTLGSLDPADSASGLRDRLVNLGYLPDDVEPDGIAPGVRAFQMIEGLEITGVADELTVLRLRERHGS